MTHDAFPLAPLIERMKREILDDIDSGFVPSTVASFGDLHDYLDANGYGGMFELGGYDGLCAALGIDAAIAHVNSAQTAVSEWLAAGRPARAAA